MNEGKQQTGVRASSGPRACIVFAGLEGSLPSQDLLEGLPPTTVLTYSRTEDLLLRPPSPKVSLVVLPTQRTAQLTTRAVELMRSRWPRCSILVIGQGGGVYERAARKGGAFYLTPPLTTPQWQDLLAHAAKRGARQPSG